MIYKTQKSGFTLIELLVVIAIIGILSAIGLTSIGSAQGRARDAKRKSDIGSLATSLNVYLDDHTTFPLAEPNSGLPAIDQGPKWLGDVNSTVASELTGANVAIPKAPKIGVTPVTTDYWYVTNTDASTFALFSRMEANGEWFVVNSKGWSNTIDGSDAITAVPDISSTECTTVATITGAIHFSPCASQPQIQ